MIRGTDNAIWRRIRLVPFDVTIHKAEQDPTLPKKLEAELPGILAWAVEGCLQWQREGLNPPREVRAATGAYKSEMDVMAAFLVDECVIIDDAKVSATDLYAAYKRWCEQNGERPESQRRLSTMLTERGFGKSRSNGGRFYWRGIGLIHPDGDSDNGSEPSEQEVVMNNQNRNPRVHISKEGSLHSLGSPEDGSGCRLTSEEADRVKRLVHEGWSHSMARAEVLGEEL